ncbi:precorrin-3B C(17)-methyltransferase [Heliobacterium undosum]|uniref:Precorrin-3B C(17)-methyltransferase n=2 Tax=Heliomicrobium undosum TaxID=121734 RepID=A0A845L0S7_9FIRM|nr:precorrin-3B C(17)-methyltransferase [Heliomicrobium undosum]
MRTDCAVDTSSSAAPVEETGCRPGDRGLGRGSLAVIGLGPGNRDQMTGRALQAIAQADVIVGYSTYVRLIEDLIEGKDVQASGMRKEIDRACLAVDLALEGKAVVVVSSGDPGVYGMAGVVLEAVQQREAQGQVTVEVIPGVTSATAAAAVLGAPLMHDFAVISLSDLLTPWDLIRRRVENAAAGDFIITLYNPKSTKRVHQIEEVRELLLQHRPPSTPVGIVRNARREGEERVLTTLGEFLEHPIDMFTILVIGNSQTYVRDGWMITPRGYRW